MKAESESGRSKHEQSAVYGHLWSVTVSLRVSCHHTSTNTEWRLTEPANVFDVLPAVTMLLAARNKAGARSVSERKDANLSLFESNTQLRVGCPELFCLQTHLITLSFSG